MRRIALTMLVCSIASGALGCDGGDEDEPRICEQRRGTYRGTSTETRGTCGPIEIEYITIEEQPETPEDAGCRGGAIVYSEDNCEVRNVDLECPGTLGTGENVTLLQNAAVTWTEDGSYGVGGLVLVIYDADGYEVCDSAYDVEIVRL